MRRIAVFVLILIVATPLLAAAFDPCGAYSWNPAIIVGDGEPATLLFVDRAVPAVYDPPTAEFIGREIRVTQQQSEAAVPRGPCNVAAAALVFPPELLPGDFHVTWIYANAWRPVAESYFSIGVTPALAVVPAHPDASTPVSLIGSGRFSPSYDPSFPTRSGSKILARQSVAASGIGIYPNGPRSVPLGLLPPGTYEAVWSMQFPALAPNRIETRRMTFTVDPAPRRRSTGGGATTVIEQPCRRSSRVLIEPPLRASDDAAIWLDQGSTDVGEAVAFDRPAVAFDGMSFHVTQQAKQASTGDKCISWRIDLRRPLLDGTTYPLTWDTVVERSDGTRVSRRWESSVPYNTVTASLEIVPGTFSPGSPVIASVTLSGPGDGFWTAQARPWVHVDGTSVFIDVDEVFEHLTGALAVLPPLAAGTYDVTITTHVGTAALHRTHTTLVIPPAGK